MRNQLVAAHISILLSLGLALPAVAAEVAAGTESGFYGGVSVRDAAVEGRGLAFGAAVPGWARFATPVADDRASRTLVFGGYRFGNDTAVEASYNSVDRYALRALPATSARGGVGLSLPVAASPYDEAQARRWNVDVFGSWAFHRLLAVYGRLGYAQTDAAIGPGLRPTAGDRRQRDGVNYGVGLRLDMNSRLGLRLEYSRFGRFAGDLQNGMPDTDQVSVGLQFRF